MCRKTTGCCTECSGNGDYHIWLESNSGLLGRRPTSGDVMAHDVCIREVSPAERQVVEDVAIGICRARIRDYKSIRIETVQRDSIICCRGARWNPKKLSRVEPVGIVRRSYVIDVDSHGAHVLRRRTASSAETNRQNCIPLECP